MRDLEKPLHDLQFAPKLIALKQLLIDCGVGLPSNENSSDFDTISQHRFLIFAQLKSTLDIIENDLIKQTMPSITYLRLDGTVESSKRHQIVTKFNTDPTIDVLLLTTHVGGLGLNLTGADTVVFIEHDWNPQKDLQAMDRAHRIGQTRKVNVYRLITRGTLEEKIMKLQNFKLNIANTIITRENSSLTTMDTEQVLDLFNLDAKKTVTTSISEMTTQQELEDTNNYLGTKKPTTQKNILDNLGELWDESQYEELNLDSFLTKLQ